ncbi:MAG TPA: Gfo/Idh/MocA family oxidoreductase [Steroidobacteraceae bacterium]|nr:Gfo/Idh/MocA family oxidoreductase [Steroidobacteraceae bacterium]
MANRSLASRRTPTRKPAARDRSSARKRRPVRAERAVPLPLVAANDETAGSTSPRRARGRGTGRRATESAASAGKVRYAVIGLGHIAQVAILPAFAQAQQNSTLAALVSDDSEKLRKLSRRYGIGRVCGYDDADELFESGEIDAVYITLPNSMHREYTERAARAGLHVLCEKPMAVTADDCERMVAVTRENDVRLMIAYRLHFERGNLEVAEMAHAGTLGDLRFFTSNFAMQIAPENFRSSRRVGGGPLYDIGIYCINAARAVFAAEPTEVLATAVTRRDQRFKEIPETVAVVMKFPQERIGSFTCSFGAADRSSYEIVGTKGSITVDPAYEYAQGVEYTLRLGKRTREKRYDKSDQFAPELLYFSDCILHRSEPEPSGEEGLADIRVIDALNRSIETGRWVSPELPQRRRRPTLRQEIRRPGIQPPPLVGGVHSATM